MEAAIDDFRSSRIGMSEVWGDILQGIGESSLRNCLHYKSASGLLNENLEGFRVRITVDVKLRVNHRGDNRIDRNKIQTQSVRVVQYYLAEDSKRLILPICVDTDTDSIVVRTCFEEPTSTLSLHAKRIEIVLIDQESYISTSPTHPKPHSSVSDDKDIVSKPMDSGKADPTLVYLYKCASANNSNSSNKVIYHFDYPNQSEANEIVDVSLEYAWFELRGCGVQQLSVHKKGNIAHTHRYKDITDQCILLLHSLRDGLTGYLSSYDLRQCFLWDASPVDVADVCTEALDTICYTLSGIVSSNADILVLLANNKHMLNKGDSLARTRFLLNRELRSLIRVANSTSFLFYVKILAKLGDDSLCEDVMLLETVEAQIASRFRSLPSLHRLISLLIYILHELQPQTMTVRNRNSSHIGDKNRQDSANSNLTADAYSEYLNRVDILLALCTSVRAVARMLLAESVNTNDRLNASGNAGKGSYTEHTARLLDYANINANQGNSMVNQHIVNKEIGLGEPYVDEENALRGIIGDALTIITRLSSLRLCWAGICRIGLSVLIASMKSETGVIAKCLNFLLERTLGELESLKRSKRGPFFHSTISNSSLIRKRKLQENIRLVEDVDFYLSSVSYLFGSEDNESVWRNEAMPSAQTFLINHIFQNVCKVLEICLSGSGIRSSDMRDDCVDLQSHFQHSDGLNSLIYVVYSRFVFQYENPPSQGILSEIETICLWKASCNLAQSSGLMCDRGVDCDLRSVLVIGYFHLHACRGSLERLILTGEVDQRDIFAPDSPHYSYVSGILKCVMHVLNSNTFHILDFCFGGNMHFEENPNDLNSFVHMGANGLKLGKCLSVMTKQLIYSLADICINIGLSWLHPVWELLIKCTAYISIHMETHQLAMKPLERIIKSYIHSLNQNVLGTRFCNDAETYKTPDCLALLAYDIISFSVQAQTRMILCGGPENYENDNTNTIALDKAIECLIKLMAIEQDRKVIEAQIKLAVIAVIQDKVVAKEDHVRAIEVIDKLLVRLEEKLTVKSATNGREKDSFVKEMFQIRTVMSVLGEERIQNNDIFSLHPQKQQQILKSSLDLIENLVGDLSFVNTPWFYSNQYFLFERIHGHWLSNSSTLETLLNQSLDILDYCSNNSSAIIHLVRLRLCLHLLDLCEYEKATSIKKSNIDASIHNVVETLIQVFECLYGDKGGETCDDKIDVELRDRLLAYAAFSSEMVLKRVNSNLILAAMNRVRSCFQHLQRSHALDQQTRKAVGDEEMLGLNRTRYISFSFGEAVEYVNISLLPLDRSRSLIEMCERVERGNVDNRFKIKCKLPHEVLDGRILLALVQKANVKHENIKRLRSGFRNSIRKKPASHKTKKRGVVHLLPCYRQFKTLHDGRMQYELCTYIKTGLVGGNAVCRIKFPHSPKQMLENIPLLPEKIDFEEVDIDFLSIEEGCFEEIRHMAQILSHAVVHPVWNSHDDPKHRVLLNFISRELEDVLSPQISGMGAVGLRTAVAQIQGIKLDKNPASRTTASIDFPEFNLKMLSITISEMLKVIDEAFSAHICDRDALNLDAHRKDRLITLQKSLNVLLNKAKSS